MARRLAVLVGVLALMVVVAAPAPAQTPGERVEATGALQRAGSDAGYDYYDITDEATGAPYLLRSESTELGSYEDQRVKISGTLRVEELFEERVRSAYVEVDRVEPADGPDQRVRVTFELTVKGEPPAGTVFVGLLGGEPVPLKLTDPDGDRVYEYTTPPMPASAGDSAVPARIAWGEGPLHSGATGPYLAGPISTIKDFGPVTPGQDTTLSATASFEDEAEGAKISDSAQKAAQEEDAGRSVEATGLIEEPEITTYQYGTHAVTDEASGAFYALRSEVVDLDAYAGQRVTVYGTLVPRYEYGQIEGGPPLVEVTWVEPAPL